MEALRRQAKNRAPSARVPAHDAVWHPRASSEARHAKQSIANSTDHLGLALFVLIDASQRDSHVAMLELLALHNTSGPTPRRTADRAPRQLALSAQPVRDVQSGADGCA
jgi:hypothetical protein